MVKLGRAMAEVIVDEYGPEEFIKRLGDPVWFTETPPAVASRMAARAPRPTRWIDLNYDRTIQTIGELVRKS